MVARINSKRSVILTNAYSECATRFKTSQVGSDLPTGPIGFEKTQSLLKVLSGFCMQDVFNLASRDEHCDNAGCTRCPRAEGPRC